MNPYTSTAENYGIGIARAELGHGKTPAWDEHYRRCEREGQIFLHIVPDGDGANLFLYTATLKFPTRHPRHYELDQMALSTIRDLTAVMVSRRKGAWVPTAETVHGHVYLLVAGIRRDDAETLAKALALIVSDPSNWNVAERVQFMDSGFRRRGKVSNPDDFVINLDSIDLNPVQKRTA